MITDSNLPPLRPLDVRVGGSLASSCPATSTLVIIFNQRRQLAAAARGARFQRGQRIARASQPTSSLGGRAGSCRRRQFGKLPSSPKCARGLSLEREKSQCLASKQSAACLSGAHFYRDGRRAECDTWLATLAHCPTEETGGARRSWSTGRTCRRPYLSTGSGLSNLSSLCGGGGGAVGGLRPRGKCKI